MCGRGWPDSLSPLLSHQARLKFPIDYPYSPPAFRFLTKMWHPNIYEVSMPLGPVGVGGVGTGAIWVLTLPCPPISHRLGTFASRFSTLQWMTPRAGSCPQNGGTPRRMSGEGIRRPPWGRGWPLQATLCPAPPPAGRRRSAERVSRAGSRGLFCREHPLVWPCTTASLSSLLTGSR